MSGIEKPQESQSLENGSQLRRNFVPREQSFEKRAFPSNELSDSRFSEHCGMWKPVPQENGFCENRSIEKLFLQKPVP